MPLPAHQQQVALLTDGIELPLPAIQQRPLRAILEILAQTWTTLMADPAHNIDVWTEPDITVLMEHRLNQILDENPLWAQLVSGITRGRESLNFDGSKQELRPDLSIQLTDGRNPNFPLVVECKLIDRAARKTIKLYCEKGLQRFVIGDYAWYARECIMLAYVRDGTTIATCLTPYLENTFKKPGDSWLTLQLPVTSETNLADLARSTHARLFRYLPPSSASTPGPVDVWHLWLALSR